MIKRPGGANPIRKRRMSDDVTLGSLARTALAIWGGNPEAAAEYILVQVMNDRKLLRSIFLPTIQDAVGDQIIPQTTSAHDNVIEPADNDSGQPYQSTGSDGEPAKRPTLAAFLDMVLPNGFRLGDVTREQVREAADHFRQNEVERSPRTGAKDRG
jgi:hypothetical protein